MVNVQIPIPILFKTQFETYLKTDLAYTNFIGQNENIELHIINCSSFVDGKNACLFKDTVCDTTFISPDYENLVYSSLEDEEGIGAFFIDIRDNIKIVSFIAHIDNKFHNHLEIALLCSHVDKKIKGAAFILTKSILSFLRTTFPEYTISLRVAKGKENTHAIAFYEKLGFEVRGDSNQMILNHLEHNHSGGSKRIYWSKMTKKALMSWAKEYKIVGIRNLSRDDLVKAIKNKRRTKK